MAAIDVTYHNLLQDILENGVKKGDRTGTGTISVFGRTIHHHMRRDGFPLITTKKMFTKGVIYELLWFLNGDTNIKYLVDHDVHIWDGDAAKSYIAKMGYNWKDAADPKAAYQALVDQYIDNVKNSDEFAKEHAELGKVYGAQWRRWTAHKFNDEDGTYVSSYLDQIAQVIDKLKNKPDDRRMIVTAWNPAEVENVVLPPCHYGFQLWTRELSIEERKWLAIPKGWKKHDLAPNSHAEFDAFDVPKREVSLMWQQRSVDTPLGLPFNIASYGFLLEMIAQTVNMVPGELIGNLGDTHLYLNQLDGVKEQLSRDPNALPAPKLVLNPSITEIDKFSYTDIKIADYKSMEKIDFPLSN